MNIAVIFAGGHGGRMTRYSRPKQFLEYRGKPILVYTIEVFQKHPMIDGIIVVCLAEWMPHLRLLLDKYHLDKVVDVVAGGNTGQDSIYNGLVCAARRYPDDTIVLIHDGVRPLVAEQTITDCLHETYNNGSCVVCVPATETFVVKQDDDQYRLPNRDHTFIARAPQCFLLGDVLAVHRLARQEGRHDFTDTCSMMHHYGHNFGIVMGSMENIKITTPADFFMFRAIVDAKETGFVF